MKKNCLYLCISLLLALILFSGCGKKEEGIALRYDIGTAVTNLDPQYATSFDAQLIITNIFEGLTGYDEDGGLTLAAAESHTVSADGLYYEFRLHEGQHWSDGKALTAQDFAFAFERLFAVEALSPHASAFSAIAGAAARMEGDAGAALGVYAPDEHTIRFTLAQPDPFFLQRLATAPAMPCNREFFTESRGRYCLQLKSVLSNGPFKLNTWDNKKYLRLLRNPEYRDLASVYPTRVTLYPQRKGAPLATLLSGEADGAVLSGELSSGALPADIQITPLENTVWVLLYNQSEQALANADIRRALSFSIEHSIFGDYPAGILRAANALVPGGIPLGGENYRSLAGELLNPRVGLLSAQDYLQEGLEALGQARLPGMQLLAGDVQGMPFLAGFIQQEWQRELGANIGILPVSEQELEKRVARGEYTIALVPLRLDSPTPDTLLSGFVTGESGNLVHFESAEYDSLIERARHAANLPASAKFYVQAEQLLIDDAVITPLFFESLNIAVRTGIQGFTPSPYPGMTYFQYAASKK